MRMQNLPKRHACLCLSLCKSWKSWKKTGLGVLRSSEFSRYTPQPIKRARLGSLPGQAGNSSYKLIAALNPVAGSRRHISLGQYDVSALHVFRWKA